jgi:glycosyltransferase involved in cell wall biosynthesis
MNSVIHIVPALFDRERGIVGGAERYAFEVARHMADSRSVTLLTFGQKSEELQVGSLRIRIIGTPFYVRGQKTNPISAALIPELLRAGTVHCHQQHVMASSISALTCRLTGKKVFVSDLGGGGWDISSYISTDRWYHGHLHISEYSRRIFGHSGKPWARVIYGGVDTEKFCPGAAQERRQTVLFVGRIMPHKGVDDLVKALPPGMRLELIGQPYNARFLEELQTLAKGKDVAFRHDCSDADIVAAYRRALCIVLPSVYRDRYGEETRIPELLGQTLLEGMACGTPAVCTNVASMPEVVTNGETGFVVAPNCPEELGERLAQLRDNPALASRMGGAARQRVLQFFTWKMVVDRCLDIYETQPN